MVPKSNVEYFLQAIIENSDTPFEAKSRIERYITDILEERVSTLEPVFRIEYYLAKISGADVELPEPISRADLYLAALAGEEVTLPDTPNSSLEEYLARWCETGNAVLTITGNPVRFTGMTNTQIQALSVNLRPIQDLHGYSNPWPAGGGKNKLNPLATYKGYAYNPAVGTTLNPVAADKSWQDAGNDTFIISNLGSWEQACLISDPLPLGKAYVKISNVRGAVRCSIYVCNGDFKVNRVSFNENPVPEGGTIVVNTTFTNDDTYFVVYLAGSGADASIQYPYAYSGYTAAIDNFSPYSNICPLIGLTGLSVYVSPTQDVADATEYAEDWTSQAGTVYGGMLDVVTGVLTVTMANIASYNGETINEPWLSSMNAYAAGATPTTGAQVVYTLATPQTYQLTPQEVESLLGVNNIWSDSGDVTVVLKNAETYEEVANG